MALVAEIEVFDFESARQQVDNECVAHLLVGFHAQHRDQRIAFLQRRAVVDRSIETVVAATHGDAVVDCLRCIDRIADNIFGQIDRTVAAHIELHTRTQIRCRERARNLRGRSERFVQCTGEHITFELAVRIQQQRATKAEQRDLFLGAEMELAIPHGASGDLACHGEYTRVIGRLGEVGFMRQCDHHRKVTQFRAVVAEPARTCKDARECFLDRLFTTLVVALQGKRNTQMYQGQGCNQLAALVVIQRP